MEVLDARYGDMSEIMKLMFLSYSDPCEPYIDLVCPGHNPDTFPGHPKGLAEATER